MNAVVTRKCKLHTYIFTYLFWSKYNAFIFFTILNWLKLCKHLNIHEYLVIVILILKNFFYQSKEEYNLEYRANIYYTFLLLPCTAQPTLKIKICAQYCGTRLFSVNASIKRRNSKQSFRLLCANRIAFSIVDGGIYLTKF